MRMMWRKKIITVAKQMYKHVLRCNQKKNRNRL